MPDDFNTLLQIFCRLAGVHVCIHDVAGIFERADTRLDARFRLHARPFCDAAKAPKRATHTAPATAFVSTGKARKLQAPFEGHCPWII